MGLRKKPRFAKAESHGDEPQPSESKGSAAMVHEEEHNEEEDGDKDSDPEMKEVYVQAYACQVFRDDGAAQAVEDGAHLRPLAMPQDPEGKPLMLDRFDARWMLDLADFNKGTGSNMPAALSEEERKADTLRYSGLPNSDHSVFVEGLGTFAPTGSYAHDRQGGLGGDNEELPEVYGYYGRTASPPRAARGAWSATPAPQQPVHGGEISSGVGETERHEKPSKGKGDEGFVPDFAVPAGVLVPSSVRQHLMMVSTARNAVRSPQLEVLLRLKQASNAAFSFLSHEDPIHPYYVFLKSWGEAALAGEYERLQRLQAELADKRKEEEENTETKEAAAMSAKGSSSLVRPPAADHTDGRGAPNLLGVAYDSSGDEEDPEAHGTEAEDGSPAVAPPASTRIGVVGDVAGPKCAGVVPHLPVSFVGGEAGRDGVSEVDDAKKAVVDKMVTFVSRNGQAFEDRVRERERSNPAFDFLSPTNKHHAYYKKRLAEARGEAPVSSTAASNTASSVVPEHGTDAANPGVSQTRASSFGARVTTDPMGGQGVTSETRGTVSTRDNGSAGGGIDGVTNVRSAGSVATASVVTADHAQVTNVITAGLEKCCRAKVELPGSRGDIRGHGYEKVEGLEAGSVPAAMARSGQPEDADSRGGMSENSDDIRSAKKKALMTVEPSKAMARSGVVGETAAAIAISGAGGGDGDGDEDPETRRANRLKRARLMKGHYKLAVLHQSSGGETAGDGQQKQRGSALNDASSETRPVPKESKADSDYLSADGISDLDDDDHDAMDDDDEEEDGDDGDDDGDEDDHDLEGNKTSPCEAPAAREVNNEKKKGSRRTSRDGAREERAEDGRSHHGRWEGTGLSDKRDSWHGASPRRGQRGDRGYRRSRSGSGSRFEAIGLSGDRSYSRGHRKADRNGDDRTGEGKTRHRSSPGGRLSPDRRSSPDRRRKRAQENRDGRRDRDGGRLDRDGSGRRKRRSSRSPDRDRRVSGARRGESRERSREVRGDWDDESRSKRRGGKDKRTDQDQDSRERRQRRSRSLERGEGRSKGRTSSSSSNMRRR